MYKTTINWKRFIINIVALVLIASITSLYFFTDIFRTKRGAFYKYFNQIPTAAKILNFDTYKEYNSAKKKYSYTRNAEMKIQSAENYADFSILDKIKYNITSSVNYNENMSDTEIEIKNDNNTVSKIEVKKDKNKYGIHNSDIGPGYIVAENGKLGDLWSVLDKNLNSTMIDFNYNEISSVTKQEKKHLNEFFKMIKQVQTTSYQKEINKTIKIDDKEYNTNAYILDLNEEEIKNLEIEMLNKLKSDSILMNYFTSKMRLININEKYTDINKLNQLLNTRVSKLQSGELKEKSLKITIYEYKRNNIRTEIKYGDDVYILENVIGDDSQKVSFSKNNEYKYIIGRNVKEYYIYVENNDDLKSSLEIKYHQEGILSDNTVSNVATITRTEGIKKVIYSYKDTVVFEKNKNITGIDYSNAVDLTSFSKENLNSYIINLKEKINKTYVQKGSEIGISLDPIFK